MGIFLQRSLFLRLKSGGTPDLTRGTRVPPISQRANFIFNSYIAVLINIGTLVGTVRCAVRAREAGAIGIALPRCRGLCSGGSVAGDSAARCPYRHACANIIIIMICHKISGARFHLLKQQIK
jgi:hypothetical protein